MGVCCSGKNSDQLSIVKNKLIKAVEKADLSKLKYLVDRYMCNTNDSLSLLSIDSAIVKIQGVILNQVSVNTLGYALRLGRTAIFKHLYETRGASLVEIARIFYHVGKTPIDIICENGHLELLKYYLPLYLEGLDRFEPNDSMEDDESEELSIFATSRPTRSHTIDKSKIIPTSSTNTAIQRACDRGYLDIIKYLRTYFFDQRRVPFEFDIHYVEPNTGENCAVIATRNANIDLIKYLHEYCRADFHIKTKRRESTVQIAVVGSKRRPNLPFYECVKYLVETVGVDITHEYEEMLLVCEDRRIVEYLENTLKIKGINISKKKVDEKYSLTRNRVPARMPSYLEEKLSKVRGPSFGFRDLFREELDESDHMVSSIPDIVERSQTPMDVPSVLDILDIDKVYEQ